jgi:hypothetical protein
VAAVAIRDNTVFRAAGGILPTVDLLRIGYMF